MKSITGQTIDMKQVIGFHKLDVGYLVTVRNGQTYYVTQDDINQQVANKKQE